MLRVGLISDTHGLLRPEAVTFLRGSDYIVHAGDIGDADIIGKLGVLAPVTAVRGNNDRGLWAQAIPESDVLQVDNVFMYILHNVAELNADPVAGGFQVVVSGHSHQPSVESETECSMSTRAAAVQGGSNCRLRQRNSTLRVIPLERG